MRLLPPPVAQRGVSTELDVDHALASLERLNEIAESMMRRLDELLMPAPLGHCASVRPTAQSAQSSVSVITHAQSERGEVAPGGVTGSTGLRGSGEASFRRAGLVSAGCDARADGVTPGGVYKTMAALSGGLREPLHRLIDSGTKESVELRMRR
jgi:hypothetical protein